MIPLSILIIEQCHFWENEDFLPQNTAGITVYTMLS